MKSIYVLMLSITCFFMLNAQSTKKTNTELDNLVKEYNQLFTNSKTFTDEVIYKKNLKVDDLWNQFISDNQVYKTETENVNPINFNKKGFFNYGFVWMSDAMHNFSTGISDNEDVYFRSRFSTGIDWVLLGDGSYLKNRKRDDLLKIEIKKDSLELNLQGQKITLQKKQEFIKYIFDEHRLALLKEYEVLLSQKIKYYDNLYNAQLNTYASKLKVSNELSRINNLITLTEAYQTENFNGQIKDKYLSLPFSYDDLPKLNSIQFDLLLNDQKNLNQLQKEILAKNNVNTSGPSLRTKVRYNYYNTDNQSSRGFASVGASLAIPLQSNKNEELVKYQMDAYDSKLNYLRSELINDLQSKHYDFYVLKSELNVVENELIYLEALLNNEVEIYKKGGKNFSPEKYISLTTDVFNKKLEELDLKQQLCEKYLVFNSLIGSNFKENFSKDIENLNMYDQTKSSYLWKKFFEENTNEELILLLKNNSIGRLFLSPGTNVLKIENFISQANSNQIQVERLVGENSFASAEDGVEKLLAKLEEIKAFSFSGVHLDIEPHTFDDYKTNKEKYINRMNQIYIVAKNWCDDNQMKLSVSIPMNLPIENAQVLFENNIEAYIMAYENTNQTKLLKRTEELRNTLQDNFVWVLRLKDFENDEALKAAENELNNKDIYKIAYYDVSMLNQN